jgi:pimeloyl-ACP methyl ester carboxylesterase
MIRRIAPAALAACLIACSGCGGDVDSRARSLVTPRSARSNWIFSMADEASDLIRSGDIDFARAFKMADGTEIDVWARKPTFEGMTFDAETPIKGTVVVLHDRNESKASYLSLCEELVRVGFGVILIDLRAHGLSSGEYITFGAREKDDVKGIVGQILREGFTYPPVYAVGIGLGATTAIQYAAIDRECHGVLAVAPYRDARTACWRRLARVPFAREADFEETLAKAGEIARFNPAQASSVLAAAQLTVPLHVVYGIGDRSVTEEDCEAIVAAAGSTKKYTTVTGFERITLSATRNAWLVEHIDALARKGKGKTGTEGLRD